MCVQTKFNYIYLFSKPGDLCVICLEKMQIETLERLSCGHAVHTLPCYDYWFANRFDSNCPYCYAEIQH